MEIVFEKTLEGRPTEKLISLNGLRWIPASFIALYG